MKNREPIKKIKKYISAHFAKAHDEGLLYHDLEHTLGVAKAVIKIAAHYELPEEEIWLLEVAALFHDTGVMEDISGHEELSVRLMQEYFADKTTDETLTDRVAALIRATRLPQQPSGLLQEIICDADLFHLGKKSFYSKCEQLRAERERLQQKSINNQEWLQSTLDFLRQHRFHTAYAVAELNEGQIKNIDLVSHKLNSLLKTEDAAAASDTRADHHREKDRPEKGIETMFRITSSNNQRLSDMADNKAHIMITVNSIILSAIISLLLRRLDAYSFLAYPTFLLLAISLLAMTFAILATRPSIPDGGRPLQEMDLKNSNLLFFGNFYKMPLEDYKAGMMQIMDDKELLYGMLIKDVYGQGAVLGKKYRLLRISYNIFMFGLILSVLAFIIVSALHSGSPEPAAASSTLNF